MINNYLKLFKLTAFVKNVLIIIPPILAQVNLFEQIDKALYGILVFFIVSTICYITNDYTDRSSDRKNPLKQNNALINKFNASNIILLNLLLFVILFLLSFTDLFGYSLVIYLFLFYLVFIRTILPFGGAFFSPPKKNINTKIDENYKFMKLNDFFF